MNRKVLSIICVLAIGLAMIGGCSNKIVKKIDLDDSLGLVYQKISVTEDGTILRDLYFYQAGVSSGLADNIYSFKVSEQTNRVLFEKEFSDDYGELYLFDEKGNVIRIDDSRVLAEYSFGNNGEKIYYGTWDKRVLEGKDRLVTLAINILDENLEKRMFTGAYPHEWRVSKDGSTLVYSTDIHSDGTGFVPDTLEVRREGEYMEISDSAKLLDSYEYDISDDGKRFLFRSEFDKPNGTGKLFLYDEGVISEISSDIGSVFGVSNSGEVLAAAEVHDRIETSLVIKFGDREIIRVENSYYFIFNDEGNKIFYLVYTEENGMSDLYMMEADGKPIKLAEGTGWICDANSSGSEILYLVRDDISEKRFDLYYLKIGEEPVKIDEDIVYLNPMHKYVRFSEDGKAIAYVKNADEDAIAGELYLKQEGKDPVLIDDNVGSYFEFLDYSD